MISYDFGLTMMSILQRISSTRLIDVIVIRHWYAFGVAELANNTYKALISGDRLISDGPPFLVIPKGLKVYSRFIFTFIGHRYN